METNIRHKKAWIVYEPEGFTILIDPDAPLELRLRLIAAHVSYQMGLKSVDGILKKYRPIVEEILVKEYSD